MIISVVHQRSYYFLPNLNACYLLPWLLFAIVLRKELCNRLNWGDAAWRVGKAGETAIFSGTGRVYGSSADTSASSDMTLKVTLKQAVGGCGWYWCCCFPPLMDLFFSLLLMLSSGTMYFECWLFAWCYSFILWILCVCRSVCLSWEKPNLNLNFWKV